MHCLQSGCIKILLRFWVKLSYRQDLEQNPPNQYVSCMEFCAGLWLGPSRTIRDLKSIKSCLTCMFRVIVMLKGEPIPHSSITCTMEKVSLKNFSGIIHPALNTGVMTFRLSWRFQKFQNGYRFSKGGKRGEFSRKKLNWQRKLESIHFFTALYKKKITFLFSVVDLGDCVNKCGQFSVLMLSKKK